MGKISRKINALTTRKKIYESAEKLCRENGFNNVSVDAIVKMAGISKGAFYLHFPSKNALICSLLADYIQELDLDYKIYHDTFPHDTAASQILLALAEKITEILSCTIGPNLMSFTYQVQLTKEVDTNILMGYSRILYELFNEIITKGIKQGEFNPEISVETVAKHCVLAIRGLTFEWCIRYPDFDLKEQTRVHFGILLNGIKNPQ